MKTPSQARSQTLSQPLEIELKLALPPDQQAAFHKLMARRRRQPVKHSLVTRYFDTADGVLSAQGIALRLRKSGRCWVQTLKTEGERQGGLSQRIEHEMAVSGACLDWSRFPAAARAWVPEAVRAQLLPVFETHFTRTAWQLGGAGGARIEVALDVGEIRAGKRRQPICEIELELKAGTPEALFALAYDWALTLDCLPLDTSKAERGVRLALQHPDSPVRFAHAALSPDMQAEEGCMQIVQACLTQFQANLPGVMAGRNSEFLHQSRVALRRLRVALRLFRTLCAPPDTLRADLRAIAAALGPARDWDVLCDEILPPIAPHFADDVVWQAGYAALEEKRASVHSTLRDTLRQLRPGAWLLAFNLWLRQFERQSQARIATTPVRGSLRPRPSRLQQWARKKLAQQHRQLIRHAPGWVTDTPARQHAFRVDIKRQRYAVEFFQALFDHAEQKQYLSAIQALQAGLGEITDIRMASRLLTETSDEWGAMRPFVLGWLAARAAGDAPGGIDGQLKKFIKTPPCW